MVNLRFRNVKKSESDDSRLPSSDRVLLIRRKSCSSGELQPELDRLAWRMQLDSRFATSRSRFSLFALDASATPDSGRRGKVVVLPVDATFLLDRDVHGRKFGRSEPFETARVDGFVKGERAVRVAGVACRDESAEVCAVRHEDESVSSSKSRP